MTAIQKAPETMNSKKRVLKTFAFEKTDRVPIDYSSNPTIHRAFCQAVGIPDGNYAALLELLGVDYRSAWPRYTGPKLFPDVEGCAVNPEYGFYTRWIPNKNGGYDDFCVFPLRDADPETIFSFPVPNPDHYDYETAAAQLRSQSEYAVYIGNPGVGDIINSIGRVMGMEDTLVNLALEDEATLDLVERKISLELNIMERLLAKAGDAVDFVWIGEDLGTQIAPMISPALYRKILRPHHQKFVDLAKSYHLPVMIHTCGSSSWAFEDFIEMGINAVDTLQPEAVNMAPRYLKDRFGGRLSFHGCVSTAGALAYGTTEDVERTVRETLEIMMPGGGYHFSPTHMIQDNTPVENIITMYQCAHRYGRY